MLNSVRRSEDDKQSGLYAARRLVLVAKPGPRTNGSSRPAVKKHWLEKFGLESEDLIAIPVCILFGLGVMVFSSYMYLLIGASSGHGAEMAATLTKPQYAVLWAAPLALVRKLLRW